MTATLAAFTVPSRTLRALASTEPSPDGTRLVRDVRRSKRLVLLRAVLDAAPCGSSGRTADHWALLEEAERHDPAAVRDVLHYPATGVWAEETLRRLHAPFGPPPDLAHLGALAAAAALRAGIAFTHTLRPVHGRLVLPTLGLLRPDRPGPLVLTERSWDPEDPATLPLHPLPGGRTALDDLDPYRAPGPAQPAPLRPARRLTPKGHKRWDTQWSGALTLLQRYDTVRAEETVQLLRSLVPLAGGSRSSGATLPAAAGCVLARAQAPPALAATLVHEVQHGKLTALADVLTLHTADAVPRHWAPWRSDPRPLEGLLHGAYAHLALAGYWQRAALYGARGAWAQHARIRAQVAAVLPALRAHERLTTAGREFTDAMAAAERAMDELPPPATSTPRPAAPSTGSAAPGARHTPNSPRSHRSDGPSAAVPFQSRPLPAAQGDGRMTTGSRQDRESAQQPLQQPPQPQRPQRFVISFAGFNRPWAVWIAHRLEEHGHRVTLQRWDPQSSPGLTQALDDLARSGSRVLLVLSERYFSAGTHTDAEWNTALRAVTDDHPDRFAAVCLTDAPLPSAVAVLEKTDLWGLDAYEAEYRVLRRLELPTDRIGTETGRRGPRFPNDPPEIWGRVPRRNPRFTGRNDVIGTLRQALAEAPPGASTVTLLGLSGVGKTQVATEYAYRFASEYDVVWWVPAEDRPTLRERLADLAPALGLPRGAAATASRSGPSSKRCAAEPRTAAG